MASAPGSIDRSHEHAQSATPASVESVTEEEFRRHLVRIGLMSEVPAADEDEDDEPITIDGEPLSETIIRERR